MEKEIPLPDGIDPLREAHSILAQASQGDANTSLGRMIGSMAVTMYNSFISLGKKHDDAVRIASELVAGYFNAVQTKFGGKQDGTDKKMQ